MLQKILIHYSNQFVLHNYFLIANKIIFRSISKFLANPFFSCQKYRKWINAAQNTRNAR